MRPLYAMYKVRGLYSPKVGDVYFRSWQPHRSTYPLAISKIISIDQQKIAIERQWLNREYNLFVYDSIRIGYYDEFPTTYVNPIWLAIPLSGICIFDMDINEISIIGKKVNSWSKKTHVIKAETNEKRCTYMCSGVSVSGQVEITYPEVIVISRASDIEHFITCSHCRRRLEL